MRTSLLPLILLTSLCFGQELPRKVSLPEAIRLAEQNSPVYKGAKADADAARAGARVVRTRTLPQLSLNGFATTGNNPSVVPSSPMVEPPAWMISPNGNILDGNLSLMVPLIAPGLQAMASSADWQTKAADGELSESRADLQFQVTEAYDRVLLARQMIAAAQAKVTATQELVRTTQALFDSGKGIEATVDRTRAELSQADRNLTNTKNDEAKAILDLQAVMGIDLASTIDPSDDFAISNTTDTLVEHIARAKGSRGMVIASRARVESANADVRAAEGQRMPQLYGVAMGDATDRRDMGGITAGLTLSFPLFDGGRVSAEVSQAKAMRSKAEAQLRLAELTVEKEVRQAWLDVQTALGNAASAEASVKSAQSAYDVTALRVSAGKSILVEQLDALGALTQAKADLAQALFDQAVALAKLNRAAGGRQ